MEDKNNIALSVRDLKTFFIRIIDATKQLMEFPLMLKKVKLFVSLVKVVVAKV